MRRSKSSPVGRRPIYTASSQPRIISLALVALLLLGGCSTTLEDASEGGTAGTELSIELFLEDAVQTVKVGDLAGATITGQVLVVVRAPRSTEAVHFYVDDVERSGHPTYTDFSTPFSMDLDSTILEDGDHTLSVTTESSSSGRARAKTVQFAVANGPEEPSEPSNPTPEPEPPTSDPTPTLFVSTDGSDSNDGRTAAQPLRTIARAAALVRPGDVVHLRGGIYSEYNEANAWVTSGEPGRPITFMAHPGETVFIDGSHKGPSSSGNPSSPQLIRLLDVDWYVFENLTFRNSGGRGLTLEGDHHVVRNVVSHGNHGDGIYVSGSENLVEDSASYDNYSYTNGGDSADGIKINRGSGNILRRVVVYQNSDDGIDLWDSTETLVEHSVSYQNGRGTTGNGQGFKLSNDGRANANSVARFNIAFSNRAFNYTDNGGGGLTAYNNTSWNAGSFGFVFRGRTGKSRHELANNLSFDDAKGVLIDVQTAGGVSPSQWNNSWNLGVDDPRFASLTIGSSEFLTLNSGSPAIDAGIDVGLAYSGRAPDLGASESNFSSLRASAP